MKDNAVYFALISAVLFGISTPAAKALLGTIHPAILAGLLYCGAGIGTALGRRAWLNLSSSCAGEVKISRRDAPWLIGAIVSGGVIAPLLLTFGLVWTTAATGSLLLTLEGVATALIAWFVFHENFDRRIALGMACLGGGAIILAWTDAPKIDNFLGPLAILGACVAWALDNNLTRKVSLADPLQIVELKGLVSGPVNVILGLATGASIPSASAALAAAGVGFLGYGVSLALFVLALRHLGTARTGAYFSTAPFFGMVAAVIFLGEPITVQLMLAGSLMAFGVWLHLTEQHEHEHAHEKMSHMHPHIHDEHHRHEHDVHDPPGEPHTHFHHHEKLRHAHAHVPDAHHHHRH